MFDTIEDRSLQRRIKRHVIAGEHRFFAVVTPGFEHILMEELESFAKLSPRLGQVGGATLFEPLLGDDILGGVEFNASLFNALIYCLFSRVASGVVMRLGVFKSFDWFVLERDIAKFPWELYLNPNLTLKFRSSTKSSMIYHRGKLEEIFAREIKKRLEKHGTSSHSCFGETTGVTELVLRNVRNRVEVSLALTGSEFYKHGDLVERGKAPLRETLAALILRESKFERYDRIIDPMCGSGTFSIEAARMATGSIHGERSFPFMFLPFFVKKRFDFLASRLGETMKSRSLSPLPEIVTSDIDGNAVGIAKRNCSGKLEGLVKPQVRNFFDYGERDIVGKTLIVLNPPYGKRIIGVEPMEFYRRLGHKLNGGLALGAVAVIVPGLEFQKVLGLRFSRKVLFKNGGIPSALLVRES